MNHSKVVQAALLTGLVDENTQASMNVLRSRLDHVKKDRRFANVDFSEYANNLTLSL